MKGHAILGVLSLCAIGCAGGPARMGSVAVVATNATKADWAEAPVVVPDAGLARQIASGSALGDGVGVLPVQVVDLDGDGSGDEVAFLVPLAAGETRSLRLLDEESPSIEPRAHAGLYVKGFEGPGWESDVLAFRLYWDERNATDIFCKRTPVLGLREYAKPEVDYHQDTPWGMDVLKVGTALGIGGFGVWDDGKVVKVADAKRDFRVVADGPLRAVADLIYTDWKVGTRSFDLTVRMSMMAGQHFCEAELWLVPQDGGPLPEFVTGVVKHPETELVGDAGAGVLGRFGVQALGPGESVHSARLGLGVAFDPKQVVAVGEDDVNTFVRLRPESTEPPLGMAGRGGHAKYRINASWEHEPEGAQSVEDYERILRGIARLRPQTTTP